MTADLFDEAEPAPREPHVYSVSELTRAVRATLEDAIGVVWVEGEVSNYRKQPSGHQYFTLKDAQSQVACVWFARPGLRLRQVPLSDGIQVQVRGGLTVYEARGQYQLNVQLVQAGGAGLLQAKFEALKRKLEAEGLFAVARKRALPRFPMCIGLVTSPTGAALQDILNILARRAPWVRVIISPARVQGEGAAEEIAAAVERLNRLVTDGLASVEVVIVGRGGGSMEDLWAFNEEVVARALAASVVPVISAVGHEIDFTIADFVADLRAPTPSAAAELIVPDGAELRRTVATRGQRLQRAAQTLLMNERRRLVYLAQSATLQAPLRRVRENAQQLDFVGEAFRRLVANDMDERQRRLAEVAATLRQHRPDQLLSLRRQELTTFASQLRREAHRSWERLRQNARRLEELFRLVSPQGTLARGYSITTLANGTVVRSATEVRKGMGLVTHLRDGTVDSTVK